MSLKDTGRIYLDHNATTPPLQSVVDQLSSWAVHWGNPSSIHWSGRGPKTLLREARAAVAKAVGCQPLEIVFTSGGSEANNLVIKGFFDSHLNSDRNEYIVSAVEHPSVMKSFEYLRARGATVHILSVNREGRIDLEEYARVLSERTALVSVMAANNETGGLMPIRKMAKMAHEKGALFHTDGVQALGKIVVNVETWGVDFATFAGHKVYALKGVGFVFAKKGLRLSSLISGGGQERGRRAGTENILALASLGHVAKEILPLVQEKSLAVAELRDFMESEILKRISGVEVTGAGVKRLGNTSSLLIDGIDGESLLMNLDLAGVGVSTGAACSSGSPEPSPVLLAMGLTRAEAQRSLRISLGWGTTRLEIEMFLDILTEVVARLRAFREAAANHEARKYV